MILSRRIRVFAYAEPVDMRKSFNTLAALVFQMGKEILEGDAFLFVSKRRNRAKVLWFDGTGLCLLAKRLEKGLFAPVWQRASDGETLLTVSELSLFLEGCAILGRKALSPPEYDHEIDGKVFERAIGQPSTLDR